MYCALEAKKVLYKGLQSSVLIPDLSPQVQTTRDVFAKVRISRQHFTANQPDVLQLKIYGNDITCGYYTVYYTQH